MNENILKVLRFGGSALLGYAAIVLGTLLFFEILLGGIGYYKSSVGELALAGLGAVITGFSGGYLARIMHKSPTATADPTAPPGVLVPRTLDVLYSTPRVLGPAVAR